jgi:hypothetical protein
MTASLRNNMALVCGFILVIVLIALNCHNSFFWDTVQLASTHAGIWDVYRFGMETIWQDT